MLGTIPNDRTLIFQVWTFCSKIGFVLIYFNPNNNVVEIAQPIIEKINHSRMATPIETAPPIIKEGITRNGSDKANGIGPLVIPNEDKIHDILSASFSYWFENRWPIQVTKVVVHPVPIPAAQKHAYGANKLGLVNCPLVKACENDTNEKAHATLLKETT